jgi:hypothetical protein
MTDGERERFGLCNRWESCSAPVCPLYTDLKFTRHIPGDRRCTKIVSYFDSTPIPEDLKNAIAETEPVWREVLSDALLEKWVKGRKQVREYFKKAG